MMPRAVWVGLADMREYDPPFSVGTSGTNYRRFDEESDPWLESDSYRERRDHLLSVFRLGSHDPRFWQVNVPVESGSSDIHMVRCEACGQSTRLLARPHKRIVFKDMRGKRIKGDPPVCRPISLEEMKLEVKRRNTSERLGIRGFIGGMFALLAISMLFAAAAAPADKRIWGYFGFAIWGTVSAVSWVSFFKIYLERRS
jgi:hypothetical protein